MQPHRQKCWVIPPNQNAEFVACMEDVLDLYQRPFDSDVPVVCMDECPVQLVKETRIPLPPEPGRLRRFDYEYERAGTAAVFLFTEALAGRRRTTVRPRRTAVDWAQEVRTLDRSYPHARRIILICDNLNTHNVASFYKAFPPSEARRLAERIEIHYTPKHGSWLNIAECEVSVLSRQCLHGRTPDIQMLSSKVRAWDTDRNNRQCGVDWQFTTEDARIKLKKLYPSLQMS
ncbi:MAG: IS630 family transposase [bacterium]